MMSNPVKKIIERVELCHKIGSFRVDDETNSSLQQCHCRNDIFVQIFNAKFHLLFRRTGCKFSPNKRKKYVVSALACTIICNLNEIYSDYFLVSVL